MNFLVVVFVVTIFEQGFSINPYEKFLREEKDFIATPDLNDYSRIFSDHEDEADFSLPEIPEDQEWPPKHRVSKRIASEQSSSSSFGDKENDLPPHPQKQRRVAHQRYTPEHAAIIMDAFNEFKDRRDYSSIFWKINERFSEAGLSQMPYGTLYLRFVKLKKLNN